MASSQPVHWLYPTNESGDYHLDNVIPDGRDLRVSPRNVWSQIDLDPQRHDSWYLSTGYRQMQPKDAIWLYAAGEQMLCALAQVVQVYQDHAGHHHADLIWNLTATRQLNAEPIPRSLFKAVPQSVRRADATTVAVLERWMSAHHVVVADWDDPKAPSGEEDARTRSSISI